MSWRDDIKRIENLLEDLQALASKIQFDFNNGKATSEVHEIINIWSELRGKAQEVKNESPEEFERGLRETDDPDQKKRLQGIIDRNKIAQEKKLKSALRKEKEAQAIYDKYKPLTKEDFKKEDKEEKKEEPKKEPEKPKEKPKPQPARVRELPKEIAKPQEKYIADLDELKAKSERAIVEKIPGIEKEVLQFLSDYMDEKFDTKDGNFVANDRAVKGLNGFTDILIEAMTELKDYKGAVGQYLKNFKDISTLMEEHQKSNGLNVKQARLGAVQELVVSEIINQYSANGLNEGFVQPLRELLFDNITGGLNKKQAMTQLRDFIASGKDTTGKLHRYLEQTAQQGVDSYTGATNVRIMQTFKIDTFVVSGSLIKTSSPQCRFVINKMDALIDRKDWSKVKDLAEQYGLIEGTTFDNLPLNKLHFGCRHEFTPVTLTEKQREKLTATPTNPAGN